MSQKAFIIQLVTELKQRTGKTFSDVVQHLDTTLEIHYTRDLFESKFRRFPKRTTVYSSDEIIELIRAFSIGIEEDLRCTAFESLLLCWWARVGFDELSRIRQVFPLGHFDAALNVFLKGLPDNFNWFDMTMRREITRKISLDIKDLHRDNDERVSLRKVHNIMGDITHNDFVNQYVNLPANEHINLFGVDELIEKIVAELNSEGGYRYISIEGLGGIGKTALAYAVAQKIAWTTKLDDILWVSARQEWLGGDGTLQQVDDPAKSLEDIINQMTKQLGQEHLVGLPTSEKIRQLVPIISNNKLLIVIDNLETLTDIEELIPALQKFIGFSRFLFTSRHTLGKYGSIQLIPVPELSYEASISLIASELSRRGKQGSISSELQQQIYSIIGGLPLALKLISAQIGNVPLDAVLTNVQNASSSKDYDMYSYIYHQTWSLLDEFAKRLIISMKLSSPDGESADWLQMMSDLSPSEFQDGLITLIDYSLVETVGNIEKPMYKLHRLTSTFLGTEILKNWN